MRRDGREFRSRTDYILGTYIRLFQDMAVQDLQHHLDYYMVLGCLRRDPENELTDYLRKARRFPLRYLRRYLASASDNLFSKLKTQIPNPPLRERVRWAWVSDETRAAIDNTVTS